VDTNAVVLELLRQALAPQPPDHIGDLIKIGLPLLGAILGAVVAFLSAKRVADIGRETAVDVANRGHAAEVRKDLGARRGVRFDSVLSSLDLFCQKLTDYVTDVINGIERKAAGTTLSAADLARIEASQSAFHSSFLDLLNAESRLLALGHANVQKDLRGFGESAQALFTQVHINNGTLTVDAIRADMLALRKKRYDLILAIGTAETAWWETGAAAKTA
jgi:hypothetical protein